MDHAEESPTTTHADWGAGDPHLIVSSTENRFEHPLTEPETRIGSSAECELRLPNIDAVHAVVQHDERDDYVLTMNGEGETSASMGGPYGDDPSHPQILRTGARFTAGAWTFVFMREEYADHGRPFGGREGGELSDQPVQPPRPDYRRAHPDASPAPESAAESDR